MAPIHAGGGEGRRWGGLSIDSPYQGLSSSASVSAFVLSISPASPFHSLLVSVSTHTFSLAAAPVPSVASACLLGPSSLTAACVGAGQYPGEKEITFPPFTCLEADGDPRFDQTEQGEIVIFPLKVVVKQPLPPLLTWPDLCCVSAKKALSQKSVY
jgi:hypothetical protein